MAGDPPESNSSMANQPMLLKAELKQYPYSYCILQAQTEDWAGLKLAHWKEVIDTLVSTLVDGDETSITLAEDFVINVRARNHWAGWQCPEPKRPYQVVCGAVLAPLLPMLRSLEEQESMSEHLDLCLHMGMMGSAMKHIIGDSDLVGFPDAEDDEVVETLKKIKNPDIVKALEGKNKPKIVFDFMKGQGHIPLHCSHCQTMDPLKLQRCAKCRVRKYCSSECQKAHWVSKHKEECPRFAEITSYKIPSALAAKLDEIALANTSKPKPKDASCSLQASGSI